MKSDTKTILWSELGVIVLTLGIIHNHLINNTFDSMSIPFVKLSASLFYVKFLYGVNGGWKY